MISVNYKLREYIKMLNYLKQTLEKMKELSKKQLMSFKDYILIIQMIVTPYLKSMLTWTWKALKIWIIKGKPSGIMLPYIVTIDQNSNQVLSVVRNFREQDPLKRKRQYFVHFKFLPGFGFYGFGLLHTIGGLSRAAYIYIKTS